MRAVEERIMGIFTMGEMGIRGYGCIQEAVGDVNGAPEQRNEVGLGGF